jgi:hypothetical protein
LEHIRLAATPTSREEDPAIAAATVGQEDIRWIPTGDPTRMDAVWIVHGLPVSLLERLEEFRAQYENTLDFPNRDEFHLNPQWSSLPDITLSALDEVPPTLASGSLSASPSGSSSTQSSASSLDPILAARPEALRRRSMP